MKSARGVASSSRGVDFSPPSPIDYSPGSSRRSSSAALENLSSSYISSPKSSIKGESLKATHHDAQTFAIQPPTGPRSMRRNISPPPLRRADTYKGSGRRCLDDYEPYRRSRRRFSGGVRLDGKGAVLDCYRPSSTHRRAFSPESPVTMCLPRSDRSSPFEESGRESRLNISNVYVDQTNSRDKHSIHAGKNTGKAELVHLKGCSSTSTQEPGSTGRDVARQANDNKNHKVRTFPPPKASELRPRKKSQQDEHALGVRNDIEKDHRESENWDAPDEEGTRHGLALSHSKLTSTFPSNHETYKLHPSTLHSRLPPTPPIVLDHLSGDEEETCLQSIEKDNETERSGVARLKPYREMSRFSREEAASTPSTGTAGSRNKHICRACRKPASAVTPLFPCTRCRKGYHDRCGNPKPRQR